MTIIGFLTSFCLATAASRPKDYWPSTTDHTGACRAFLENYKDAYEEAAKNPYAFARDFRAYNFPNQLDRIRLLEIVFSSTNNVPTKYLPLFKIHSEVIRTQLFAIAYDQDPQHALSDIDLFEITTPGLLRDIFEHILKSPIAKNDIYLIDDILEGRREISKFIPPELRVRLQNMRDEIMLSQ